METCRFHESRAAHQVRCADGRLNHVFSEGVGVDESTCMTEERLVGRLITFARSTSLYLRDWPILGHDKHARRRDNPPCS